MRYRILGALRVLGTPDDMPGESIDLGGPRQQLVLAVLLLRANGEVPVDELIDAVWGAHPPKSARKTAQAYVSRLRRLLGEETVVSTPAGYRLVVEQGTLDADAFGALVAEAEQLRAHEPDRARRLLDDALRLWRGRAWGALADEQALVADANRLEERRLETIESRHELALATGHDRGLVAELQVLVGRHPLRERIRGLAMVALYRSGRQGDALAVYEDLRTTLAEELGTDPGPEIRTLHRRVLQQDPALSATGERAVVTTPAVRNPYKGLRPFDRADADDFFGRDALTAHLVAHVADHALTAVVGPSGSGKSSVVRAGLLPALADGAAPGSRDWPVATMMPGTHPFDELRAALERAFAGRRNALGDAFRGDDLDLVRAVLRVTDDERDLVLVVDQFEELYVARGDDHVADRFARNLAEAAEDPNSRLRTVVTVRADFLDRPLADPRLGRWIDRGMVAVLPLTPAEVEEACVAPAATVGVGVEPELTAQLVADVARRPGALPMFQYALTEIFEARGDGPLTLAVHDRLGGLHGVLARRAEEVWADLDAEVAEVARDVFLRLVTPGEGSDDTRRRVRRSELEAVGEGAPVEAALEAFGQARLLTFDRDAATGAATVELAHEAMLEAWPRLRAWIDGARGDLRLHRQLGVAARDWDEADREPGLLLRGTRLDLAIALADGGSVAMTEDERDFVDASRERRAEQRRAEEDRQRHERQLERRANRRLRLVAAVLAIAAVAGAGLTAVVLDRSRDLVAAEQTANVARDGALLAVGRTRAGELTSGSVAVRESNPELSLLLALHAVEIIHELGEPIPADTVAALHWGLQEAGVGYPAGDAPVRVLAGPEGPQGVHDLPIVELVTLARSEVSRQLTSSECASWLRTETCPDDLPEQVPADLRAVSLESVVTDPAHPPLTGTTVTWLTSGLDQAGLQPETDAFREATGIDVQIDFEWASHLFDARLASGDVDVAILAAPAEVVQRGSAGQLVELGARLDTSLVEGQRSSHLVSLGTAATGLPGAPDEAIWGLPHELSLKSVIWYPPGAFAAAGYEVPATWEELVALVERITADGRTPWCHAETQGLDTGWPSTDWIEDLVLHDLGPEGYDDWVRHRIPFDDPRIRRAFERYAELLLEPGRILGGRDASIFAQTDVAWRPLLEDPPGCWLIRLPSFATQWFGGFGVRAGEELDMFFLPPLSAAGRDTVLGAGGYLVALRDRPEVREAIRWLLGPQFGQHVAGLEWETTWSFSANRDFSVDAYADPVERDTAEIVRDALARNRFRFDGSDLMPLEVSDAFWEAMVMYLQDGPDNLDAVLAHVEEAWAAHEDGE